MMALLRTILSNLFAIHFMNNVTGHDMCNTNICLYWEMNVNTLTLTCRITNLHLRVFIDDPYGETQAVCLPPDPFICEAYYKNGSILYSTITQEVEFMLDRTNRTVDGFWSCRHGTGRDISRVYVSMITTTGSKSTSTVNSKDKMKDKTLTSEQTSPAWSSKLIKFKTYSDLVTVNKVLQSTQFIITDVEQEQTNVKLGIILGKFYGLFIGAALLVLVMFVVCSIWISRRFRQIQLKIDARKQNHLNENEEQSVDLKDDTSERRDRISDYDSINENEIIPGPSSIVLGDKGSSSDTNNIATTHTCNHENTSSSDNSYLEVIDDSTYQNDYQSIEIYHGSDIVHDYCTTTSGINFLEMSSPVLTDKSLNEQSSICDTDVSISNDKLDVTVQSESLEINAIVSEINGKTLFTVQPNCNRSNDGCIVPSHSMSTLL